MDLWQIVRFNAAGGIAAGVHLVVVWVTVHTLGWSLLSANVVAFLLANALSYVMQSRWTFKVRPQTSYRWYAASLITLLLAGGVGRAADLYMPGSRVAWVLVVIPIAATNYLVMRFWVFAPGQAPAPRAGH